MLESSVHNDVLLHHYLCLFLFSLFPEATKCHFILLFLSPLSSPLLSFNSLLSLNKFFLTYDITLLMSSFKCFNHSDRIDENQSYYVQIHTNFDNLTKLDISHLTVPGMLFTRVCVLHYSLHFYMLNTHLDS